MLHADFDAPESNVSLMATIASEHHSDHRKQIEPDIRTNCPAILRDITSHFLGVDTAAEVPPAA
jgi:hypothetical protein